MKRKYTVAVDFDGVIHSYSSPWKASWVIPDPPVEGAIHWLFLTIQEFEVVIFTTRGKWWWGRLAVRLWLKRHADGLYYEHPGTRGIEDVRITATKEAALIYLDDRAVRFTGTNYPTTREVHDFRPWNKPRTPTRNV